MSQRRRKRTRFCQKAPPFLTYLKNILRKYPDGGQILKELIQNADDAGASEVIFVYDEREYEKENLWSEELHSFQGPALLAYNNATFSEDDWDGIQSTGNSLKLKDPNTVGRFGLGFNSVYHITDIPSVLSSRNIGMFDPQGAVFDDGGFLWNLEEEEDRNEVESFTDQFLPFCNVLRAIDRGNWDNIKKTGSFKGTLFRFPLRSRPSEISDNLYNTERVKELFNCFSKDASISLLFLRNVSEVSLKSISCDGTVKHLLTVSVTKADNVKLENIQNDSSKLLTSMHVKDTSLKGASMDDEVCKWFVITGTIKDGVFHDLEDLAKKLCNHPTISIAYCLDKKGGHCYSGRLSCFLPLPDREDNRTGLPIIINASFDLTDDRRSIKWVEVDQQHDDAAQWNHLLVEQILPLVYCHAVQAVVSLARSMNCPATLAYGIWPDSGQTQHKERWHWLTEMVSKELLDMNVLCKAADATQWLKPSEAIFIPAMQEGDIQLALEELLLCLNEPLVKVPGQILDTLHLASGKVRKLKMATPSFIRAVLKSGSWSKLHSIQKLLILEYVISDGQYRELLGLQLLPLSDSTFIKFLDSDREGIALMETPRYPRILLPGLAGCFLRSDLKPGLLQHLRKIGESKIFTNLQGLDKGVIMKNLLNALPRSWLSSAEQVTWHQRSCLEPPREWLHVFWTFLQQDVDALAPFEGYPLVPLCVMENDVQQLQLARLRQKSSLLFQNKDGHNLAENSIRILETLGCTVIHQWDSKVWHKDLSNYILTPTSNNILKTFSNLGVDTVIRKLTAMSSEEIKLLTHLLSQATFFSTDECKVLSLLPIFCKLNSLQSPGLELVAAVNVRAVDKCSVPAIPRDLVLPETLLDSRDEQDRRLLLQMKVPFLSAADVAALSVLAIQNGMYLYQQNQAESIMLWILRNGDVLFSQSNELRKNCESLPFIPCNRQMVRPSSLFDPQMKIFQEMFEPQMFPPNCFQEPQILKSLRTLGLKNAIEHISMGDVLQIADDVSRNQGIKQIQVLERKARALVKVCNDTQLLFSFDSKNRQSLCSMAWVPCMDSNSRTIFCKPKDMRNKKHSSLVEFSMPITDEFNEQASNSLGLNDSPPPEKVVENLKALSLRFLKEDFGSLVMKLHNIYKHVQDNLGQFCGMINGMKIWNGEGFSDPSEILLSYPEDLDLSSQIKKVPQDFLIYKRLFQQCGVRETTADGEIASMLQKVMNDIHIRSSGCGTDVELKFSISVLDWMKRRGLHSTDDLPIPVQSGTGVFTLKPLSTVLFCDMSKECLNDLGHDLDYHIVHEDITWTTATFLKVPLLSTKILKPEYFEPWGPSEPITLRIKNILREYSEEVDLFKELIQNADDAGATICNFLVDMRQNLSFRNSLIDPEMASCQGPALWSFNNSKFSDEDFCNITRVGAATKELQVEKIGKFGLGFNTVYRVTDVPSILSGSSILMFDPNANHLKKHIQSEANPGIKLNLQKHPQVLQLFTDQFHPYEDVFGCDLKGALNYNGTLIRLPFRTIEDAKRSKICDQSFDEQEIKVLVNIFQESSQNLIVFLKGVHEVTLGFLPPDLSSPDKQELQLKLCREDVHMFGIPGDFLLQKKQEAVSAELSGSNVVDVSGSKIIKVTGIQNAANYENYYLLHSSFGIGESFQIFQENTDKKTRFSLPAAGLALPLIKNLSTGRWKPAVEDFDGQVFCFLPLPIFSGFPFHLNGSFSVMSNRKSLWEVTRKGDWNKSLLCDAVLVAWARALAYLQIMYQNGDLEGYTYHTFWPDIRRTKSVFIEALKAFYRAVAYGIDNEVLSVFSNGHMWCSIKHACFLSPDIVENQHVGEVALQVFSEKLPVTFVAIHLPQWVKDGFHASGCSNALFANTYNWERFFRDIVFNNLNCLAAENRDTLVIHAIDMNNKEVDQLLKSVPCIPSTPSGTLQLIANLVHPHGKVAPLFEKQDRRFPQGTPETYLNSDRLSRLERLGMLKDTMPITQLAERALTITALWTIDRQKACTRINCVLELLRDLVELPFTNTEQAMFRKISFLPSGLPYGSSEQENDIVLKSPIEIYHYKYLNLVNMSESVLSKEHIAQDFSFTSDICEFLGLDHCPSFQTVMLQLEKARKKTKLLTKQELAHIFRKCYTYLNTVIKPNTVTEIRSRAQTFPFVLIGHECVPLNSVARNILFDAAPYLYQLPKEYQVFDKLWDGVGLSESFGHSNYMAVLQSMAKTYKGKALPKRDLKLALTILNTGLLGTADEDAVSQYESQGIFLPDQHCVLRPADKLHFNDTPWLPCDKNTLFCHKMIPRPVALRFRVPTKIHKTLQNLKMCELSHWVSNFGAKEDLTRRIKNIISEYSSKEDILKELIQNADDSGATELHFVWDSRTHPAMRVFGETWQPLQGPALCIYNNKLFTNEDIDGIQQLGKGSKGDKLDKTGKYGLGFNAVYHLTDCPSFVTGDSMLCVFDPNLLFLPTSDDNSPGGMFAVNQEFKDTFKDVYTTFLPKQFNLQQGTLFRLPLRTAETVSKSQISDQTVSSDDVKELWKALERDADNLMLFLNNLKTITFSVISMESHQLENIISVEAKLSSRCAQIRKSFKEKLCLYAEADVPPEKDMPYQVFYRMQVKCSSSTLSSNWILARQIGVYGEDREADVQKACKSLRRARLPHGAVAACVNDHVPGRAFCTLPLPVKTGLPVHINGNFILDSARRDICKEDGGSPKTEWNSLLLSHLLAPLYADILKHIWDILTQSTDETFKFMHLTGCENVLDPKYLRFFPTISQDIAPFWQNIIMLVYCTVHEKQFPLIPIFKMETTRLHTHISKHVCVAWAAVGQGTVTEEPYFTIDNVPEEVMEVLQAINMKLVNPFASLCRIFEEFRRAEVEALDISPLSVCNFLKIQKLLPEGRELPCPVSETLLRNTMNCCSLLNFCLNVAAKTNVAYLNGVPLLVTEDGNLREFNKDEPKYYSRYYNLFPMQKHHFATYKYITSEHADVLKTAGFLKEFTIQASADYIKEHLGTSFQILGNQMTDLLELSKDIKEWLQKVWQLFESKICKPHARDEKAIGIKFQELISFFSDWAILPVSLNNDIHERFLAPPGHHDRFLVPLGQLNNVLYDVSGDVEKCLSKLGFTTLSIALIPVDIQIHCLKSLVLQTGDCYSVIQKLSARTDLQWNRLVCWEIDRLLKYFIDGISEVKNKADFLYDLQSVPLFETTQKARVCLNSFNKIYILETKLSENSKTFEELYQLDPKTVFLNNSPMNKVLAKHLNIKIINDLTFFITFVIPQIPQLQEVELLKTLQLLVCIIRYDWQLYPVHKNTIVASFQPVKLIRNSEGDLQEASYFYDKNVPSFSTLGLHSKFIPEQFLKALGLQYFEIQNLLIDLGMKGEISEEDFIMFAMQIEREAKGGTSVLELTPKIEVLFHHLLSLKEAELQDSFVNKTSCIKFLIPLEIKTKLQSLHLPHAQNTHLIALRNSLVIQQDEDIELLWTSVAILSTRSGLSKNHLKVLQRFGVLCEPPSHLVLENVKNICKTPCCTRELVSTRSQVLQTMYTFLQKDPDFEIALLKDLSCILVDDDALAEPNQVVFSLSAPLELRPYLYKLPPLLACFSMLFQKIGVQPEATLFHYARALAAIHAESSEKESLHPNLKRAVFKATQEFFRILGEDKTTVIQDLKPLYLLATDGKLYESDTLVLLNKGISMNAINKMNATFKFLASPNGSREFKDLYQLERVIDNLPENMRPKLFSQIVNESICDQSLELCKLGDDCQFKGHLQELLSSREFQDGLACLLRWQSNGDVSDEEAAKECSVVFCKLKIICCCKLEAILIYDSQPLCGTNRHKQVIIVKGSNDLCQVYIEHREERYKRHGVRVLRTLAKEINGILKNILQPKCIDLLMEMLECRHPEEISHILRENGVRTKTLTCDDAFSFPPPGETIPGDWHDCLDMSILNSFKVGDYVGYMDPSGEDVYLYAVIQEQLESKISGQTEVQMFRISLGPDRIIDATIFDLYQFKRSVINKNACRELVVVENLEEQKDSQDKWFEKSLGDIKKEIDDTLSEIWKLSSDERMKAVRRLYLKYHPDKNIGQEKLATEICKYLQQRIKDLETGRLYNKHGNSNNWSKQSGGFSNFWGQWDGEAHQHRRYHEHFSSRSNCDYDFWKFHRQHNSKNKEAPRPEEAKRWFRQAECDLRAAANSVGLDSPEWVFYKVHQAVEKSLIAAHYKLGRHCDFDCPIIYMAAKVSAFSSSLNVINSKVSQLLEYGVDNRKTQYPHYHPSPCIPNERFPLDKEEAVLQLAKDVLDKMKEYIQQ
ncbi:sacsin-like isoform X1 [Lissotriton helveticus]